MIVNVSSFGIYAYGLDATSCTPVRQDLDKALRLMCLRYKTPHTYFQTPLLFYPGLRPARTAAEATALGRVKAFDFLDFSPFSIFLGKCY